MAPPSTDEDPMALLSEKNVGGSVLGLLAAEDEDEAAGASEMEEELKREDAKFADTDINMDMSIQEESEEELARKGERQVIYKLYPSRKYVMYIAKKNAQRTWTKDGPDGKNKGCIEVQIAIATERIRAMVIHMRENTHDYKCRLKLVSLVARRRAMLDKLSWKDMDSYLKIREALKIRHVYRMEALIGRLPRYKYAIRDRKRAPGRKTAMRLKKTRRLLQRRLASQLRQGRPDRIIQKTKRQIRSRNWYSRAYDDVAAMAAGKDSAPPYVDPLNPP